MSLSRRCQKAKRRTPSLQRSVTKHLAAGTPTRSEGKDASEGEDEAEGEGQAEGEDCEAEGEGEDRFEGDDEAGIEAHDNDDQTIKAAIAASGPYI